MLVRPKCGWEVVFFSIFENLIFSAVCLQYLDKLPPLKRILALPTYGQKCTVSKLQSFIFVILKNFFTAKKSDRKMSIPMLFLSSFGLMRGLMKAGNTPDHARAARIVLKDFVQGM